MVGWLDYREVQLSLRDRKAGFRTVWLSEPGRGVLDGLDQPGRWVFPASSRGGRRAGAGSTTSGKLRRVCSHAHALATVGREIEARFGAAVETESRKG